ncbi:sensor histidine kinase [Alkalimarinus coralli]|uniref:sensor histidine kinase n=1 Tax=Alkalimarinus coralli TaxID=2935863 RepID=UPI00202AF398|nr:sensor histidine kinase [Alkalimarinus coralli]
MNLVVVFSLSMWATLISTTAAGGWLIYRAQNSVYLRALGIYCLTLALWCAGHLFAIRGDATWAIPLLLSSPILPTAFLHFTLSFCKDYIPKAGVYLTGFPTLYFISGMVSAISLALSGAELTQWLEFTTFISLNTAGWVNLAYTAIIGVVAHLLLLQAQRDCPPNQRRSIIAMFIVGGLGFALSISFVFPSIGVNISPYPMLAFPAYGVLLVYAVVRYQLVEVNRFMNRAVVWLALVTITVLVMSALLALATKWGFSELAHTPVWQLLIYSAALLILAAALYHPAQRFADRLIYPEIRIDQAKLEQWCNQLDQVADWDELKFALNELWSHNSTTPISVMINQTATQSDDPVITQPDTPTFIINTVVSESSEHWKSELTGWQHTTPSEQHLAEVICTLLPAACAALDRGMRLAAAEREKLEQEHLVELGSLTAVIAHELRNPLNIINMAATQTVKPVRDHITSQVERAELLIQDILTYAGQIKLHLQPTSITALIINVAEQTRKLFKVKIRVETPDELWANVDPQKLSQVLINLLENAASFVNQKEHGEIKVQAQIVEENLLIHIHNNGPSISPDITSQLFSAFISKRSGGSGLGLAIVRRIVDAHNGRVWHHTDAGWPVTFSIKIPHAITNHADSGAAFK